MWDARVSALECCITILNLASLLSQNRRYRLSECIELSIKAPQAEEVYEHTFVLM